jgi:hypothetical protein
LVKAADTAAKAVFLSIGRVRNIALARRKVLHGFTGNLSCHLVTFLAKMSISPTKPSRCVAAELALVLTKNKKS